VVKNIITIQLQRKVVGINLVKKLFGFASNLFVDSCIIDSSFCTAALYESFSSPRATPLFRVLNPELVRFSVVGFQFFANIYETV
jgi:hypothetical protein